MHERIYLFVYLRDFPRGIYEIRGTENSFIRRSHKLFLSPCVVCLNHREAFIAQQREIEMIFINKLFMRDYTIFGNPENYDAPFLKFRDSITETARFFGTSRRIVFGIKIQDHPFTAVLFESMEFPILIGKREIRGFCH